MHMRKHGSGQNGASQSPSLFSWISNSAPVLCLQLSSTPRFFTLCDQAVRLLGSACLLSFISDAAVFPDPSLLRDCGLGPLRSPGGGSHQAMAWSPSCTQECLGDHATADAQRLRLGASPPWKKFTRLCSSSVSGIMVSHNTHLEPDRKSVG